LKGFLMKKRYIATIMMIFTLMVLVLVACGAIQNGPASPFSYTTYTPPSYSYNQEAAYAAAQTTLVAGQNEITDLSRQATVISMNINQAANAAAQTTVDYNQRQLMELSFRGTEISQDMAAAAATATAQSQAATATYSAYILNVTQTAQSQAILDVQATHTAQAIATQTAYSLTATPFAALQAEIVRSRNEADRRAWWGEFVVTPLKLIFITLVVILLIVGGVLAYRRLMPVLELRLRTLPRDNDSSMLLVDGTIVDAPPLRRLTQPVLRLLKQPSLPSDEMPQVEIIGPSEPSVTNWITEAEEKLRSDGWIQP
jgi:hypothetical protein